MAKYVQPNFIVDSSAAFLRNITFDSSVYLQGVTHISSPAASSSGTPYALVVDSIGADVQIQSKQLGTMAFETSTNYYGKTQVDGLIADVSLVQSNWQKAQDASISALRAWELSQDASIVTLQNQIAAINIAEVSTRIFDLETSVGALDVLTQAHTAELAVHDASIGSLTSWQISQDASIAAIQGRDAAQDASIIALRATDVTQDASIVALQNVDTQIKSDVSALWAWDLSKDASIIALRAKDANIDTSLNALWSYEAIQDASIAAIGGGWKPYVDGSLATRDSSIEFLFAWDLAKDASIVRIDASLNDVIDIFTILNASLGLYATLAYVDGSLAERDSSIDKLFAWELSQDASIQALRTWDLSQDGSIIALRTANTNQDTSIAALDLLTQRHEASIGFLVGWDLAKDASIIALRTKDANIDTSLNFLANWNVNQDASIVALRTNIETSLGLYVKKAGDTMTGPLVINAGGLQVAGDVSIISSGNLYVDGDAAIKGSLTINGSLYVVDVESIDVSSAYIHLNTGLTGAPPLTLQSGIVVGRGTENPYVFVYDESQQTFRIGIATLSGGQYQDSSTQAVATREDSPLAGGIAFWNDTLNRFDTSTGFTAASVLNHFTTLDASVQDLRTWQGIQDSSIALLETWLNDVSTDKISAVASTTGVSAHAVYSGEANNVAYIKQIVAGTGATITSDASTITIAVSGAAGYVSKYAGTFDGTAGTSLSVTAATHGRGIGPLQVTVYDGTDQVWVDVDCAANGDITLEWTGGSLSASCKYIIMG